LTDQGLAPRKLHGDLRDVVTRQADEGEIISVGPDDTLAVAYGRMRQADVSQLPVMDGDRLVGILDDSDIVQVLDTDEITRAERFAKPVKSAMSKKLDTVQVHETLNDLIPIFERDHVAIVMDGQTFVGLITRVDLINHLKLNQ
jgi:cystathionine beta-synthase